MTEDNKKLLLAMARSSIQHGLDAGCALEIDIASYPLDDQVVLREKAATFVTLQIDNELRGCVGTLQAYQPLILDVAEHAYCAAFTDPRFPPLAQEELKQLHIEISVLSPMTAIVFNSEAELVNLLTPKVDGLTIEDDSHRATYLPQVWDNLMTPKDFLNQLKLKAGFNSDYWSDDIRAYRYSVLSFEEATRGPSQTD